MWNSGSLGFGLPGAGRTWIFSFARLAKAVMAAPPSQQKSVKGGIRSPNASFRLAASRRGRTASNVAPLRSRATTTGICSAERPALTGFAAEAARGSGEAAPPTLEGLEDECFIGLDDARKALGFVEGESGEKPMPSSEGGARVDLAALGRLGEALPFDQGSRLIEPAILVVQAGHRSAGERIESLATFRAAIARQTSRLAPGPDIERAAARTSRPRITLLCGVPENIALARWAKRCRNCIAALLGSSRPPPPQTSVRRSRRPPHRDRPLPRA